MQKLLLKPLDQLFLLNSEIYKKLNEFKGPVLVVGGQAVAYWLDYYSNEIDINSKDKFASQSVDIDYATCKSDVQSMANLWGVDVNFAENHPPPSIAVMKLEDRNKKIKENDKGFLFIDVDEFNNEGVIKSNIVDIIDWPAGFSKTLLSSKKEIKLYSSLFLFPESFKIESHDKLKILSPLGCLKSRMANLFHTQKNKEIEVTRIKLLREPLAYYLQDLAADDGFKEYKLHLNALKDLIFSKNGIQLYTMYGVNLIDVYKYIATVTPNTPKIFIEKELPSILNKMNKQYQRRKQARDIFLERK